MKVIAQVQITTGDGVVHQPGETFEVDADWLVDQGLAIPVKVRKTKSTSDVDVPVESAAPDESEGAI